MNNYVQNKPESSVAILAAGCFWGVQFYFDQLPGVVSSEVGYISGSVDHPTYEQVCSHTTGHAEAVKIAFDPSKISYEQIIKEFFSIHDPTQLNRQGPDVGDNYRSAIFYTSDEQKQVAAKLLQELEQMHAFKNPVVTTLEPATTFWPAEPYHQKFTERTGHGACHVKTNPWI
jgi:methionine-S-sulfoxide reductase